VEWQFDQSQHELLDFTKLLIRLFHQHPVLRRRRFFQGRRIRGSEVKDLTWFRPDGQEMQDEDWNNWHARCLGLRLAGDGLEEVDTRGNRIVDETLLILLNAHYEPIPFRLPAHRPEVQWELVLDTREATGRRQRRVLQGGNSYGLEARSLALLSLRR
jgi:isoamylase